jgi:hypothetical protein
MSTAAALPPGVQPVDVEGLLALDAQGWSALGSMLLGVAAVAGGRWAFYNYHQTRRYEEQPRSTAGVARVRPPNPGRGDILPGATSMGVV